jgi:hypothetical protein
MPFSTTESILAIIVTGGAEFPGNAALAKS